VNRPGASGVYPAMQSQTPTHDWPVALAAPAGPAPERTDPIVVTEPYESADLIDLTVVPTAPQLDFETFYRDAYADIGRALTVTLGDLDLAQEATDEAMVRAYARWEKVRAYDNPGGWVYRVGLNWARSARRRLTRVPPFHDRRVVDPPVSDPANAAALQDLDVSLRAVVVCRLLLDWSVDETATALRLKPGTVKSRLHRALAQLERTLGEAS
jgi:DNA-directed RNA polymerase specialized sigma24 family protein